MKKIIVVSSILLMLVIIGCSTTGKSSDRVILHERWPFLLGVAVPGAMTNNGGVDYIVADALNPRSPQYALLKHFNVVVAENEMKPYSVLPNALPAANNWSNSYRWDDSDRLVEYAEANGKKIRGHVLIWHGQTPDWFFRGRGREGRATIDELYFRMENHIRTVFERYGGKIEWWDVVNEVVSHDTSGPRIEDSLYAQIMMDAGRTGMDIYEYVLRAFEWSRKYADENGGENVKLYVTDFGIERPFTRGTTTKQDDFYALVQWLIDKGAPIDGVGFQGHFRLYDHPVEQISAGIDRFAAMEIKPGKKIMVQVCELDISIFSNAKEEARELELPANIVKIRLKDLAQTYRTYFDMFEQKYKEGKLDMVLVWGIADEHSWLNSHPFRGREDYPLLFDRNHQPKEAYRALIKK